MFNKYFSQIYDSFKRRRWLVIAVVGLSTVIAAVNLRHISFENNVESMLPDNEEMQRSMRFLRESNFSDKVVLSFNLESDEYTTQDLIAAVDRLRQSLGPPLISDVTSDVSEIDITQEALLFSKYIPQLFDEQVLTQTERQITPEKIQARLGRIYRQMLSPASSFMEPLIRVDPLGISFGMLREVERLSSSLGYDVAIEQGHFISRDGKHALLVLETPVILTDGFGSRKLISYLRERLEGLPNYVSADIIAGHLHTLSNEDVIKKDIRLMLTIASVAFFLLFLCVFRNIRALMIFLMPLASVLISITLSLMVFKRLSYFIVGMGAVIVGIAIDYGIHVYVAVRTAGNRPDIIRHVAKPVLIGALTTMGVFAAFLFSGVSGYRQLGVFAILSIIICLVYALFILPHFLGDRQERRFIDEAVRERSVRRPIFYTVITCSWAILMFAAVMALGRLTFNNDIRQFDGSEPEIIRSEEKFHHIWGGREQPAIMVVSGETLEEASRKNESIYYEAVARIGEDNFSSIARVWPSKQSRTVNVKRWEEFWRWGRETELKKLIHEYSSRYNFSDDAFAPFFKNLYAGTVIEDTSVEPVVLERLKNQFILKKQNGYQILSFFSDEEQYITELSAITGDDSGIFLVSRRTLSNIISRTISSEVFFILLVAGFLILPLTFLLLRDVRLAVIALIPVASAVIAILGIFSLFRMSLNVSVIVAVMVVVGLSIDYGIFMVYRYMYELNTGTPKAVTLSAVTTLIGAGVLLFSQHPVLFYIGITLVVGILAGYIASLAVVPSVYALWGQGRKVS